MRKLFIGAVLGVVVLAMAGLAFGQDGASDTVQEFELTYTTERERASTGTVFHAAASSQSNPGGQPAPAREVDLGLAPGTTNKSNAVRRCNADDSDFGEEGADACPSASEVGEGVATSRVVVNNTPADVTADVTAFNRRGGLILYIQPRGGLGQPFTLRPRFTREGGQLHLVTTVPPLCVPPGTFNTSTNRCESNGAPSPNGEAVLIAFDLETEANPRNGTRAASDSASTAQNRKRRKRRRPIALLRTPKRCPSSGEWEISGKFTYGDGSSKTLSSTTPCDR